MTEQLSHFLDTALGVILAVIGWMIKKLTDRLDNDEKRQVNKFTVKRGILTHQDGIQFL